MYAHRYCTEPIAFHSGTVAYFSNSRGAAHIDNPHPHHYYRSKNFARENNDCQNDRIITRGDGRGLIG